MPTDTPEVPTTPPAGLDPEAVRNEQLRARQAAIRAAPRAVPVTDVAIIMGMMTKGSGRQETVIDINQSHRILECTQTVKEKVRPVTEDGQFLGYEPTGEYELTLKVKYLKES